MRRLRLVEAGDLPESGIFGRDLALRDFRRYLGQSRDGLCYDASGGLFPNAFTALAGTVTDGHDLRLYLPSAYPDGDPDHRRLLDFGLPTDGCADFFNARLRRFASNEMVAADAAPEAEAVQFSEGPQVFVGRRGRGKSSRLAAKARWLGAAKRLLVVAPFCSNLTRLQQLLADMDNVFFLSPDDALFRAPQADFLLVDEASAVPPAQLLALTARFPRYALAASEDGYEGHGRVFSLQVLPQLVARDGAEVIVERQAWRFAHGDALEAVLDAAFLLQPELGEAPASWTVSQVGRAELAADEVLLQAVFALLFAAHYRTTPEDLKRLLDLPQQMLFVAADGARVAGVLSILLESPLPKELAAAVLRGERRPQGRLLLQQLLTRTGEARFNHPWARISRIAVHPALRRQGIATALIQAAQAACPAPLGVSYGHSAELAAFWQTLGFHEVWRAADGRSLRPTSLRLCATMRFL